MAGLGFCLNRRQGTTSTAVVYGDELKPGYRVQIREKRVYGQIWEGTIDGNQLCDREGKVVAFVGLRAVLNVPAPCLDAPLMDGAGPVGMPGGDPVINPLNGPIEDPLPPDVDPPGMDCLASAPQGGQPRVEVIIADYEGHPVSCDECKAALFP